MLALAVCALQLSYVPTDKVWHCSHQQKSDEGSTTLLTLLEYMQSLRQCVESAMQHLHYIREDGHAQGDTQLVLLGCPSMILILHCRVKDSAYLAHSASAEVRSFCSLFCTLAADFSRLCIDSAWR